MGQIQELPPDELPRTPYTRSSVGEVRIPGCGRVLSVQRPVIAPVILPVSVTILPAAALAFPHAGEGLRKPPPRPSFSKARKTPSAPVGEGFPPNGHQTPSAGGLRVVNFLYHLGVRVRAFHEGCFRVLYGGVSETPAWRGYPPIRRKTIALVSPQTAGSRTPWTAPPPARAATPPPSRVRRPPWPSPPPPWPSRARGPRGPCSPPAP